MEKTGWDRLSRRCREDRLGQGYLDVVEKTGWNRLSRRCGEARLGQVIQTLWRRACVQARHDVYAAGPGTGSRGNHSERNTAYLANPKLNLEIEFAHRLDQWNKGHYSGWVWRAEHTIPIDALRRSWVHRPVFTVL